MFILDNRLFAVCSWRRCHQQAAPHTACEVAAHPLEVVLPVMPALRWDAEEASMVETFPKWHEFHPSFNAILPESVLIGNIANRTKCHKDEAGESHQKKKKLLMISIPRRISSLGRVKIQM